MTFVNENWYHLFLLGEDETIAVVPPYSTVELPSYFQKYNKYFKRKELSITPVYTPYPVGSEVFVYSPAIQAIGSDGNGYIVDKDEISYKVDLGTDLGEINFPWSVVELANPTTDDSEIPTYNGVILYYRA